MHNFTPWWDLHRQLINYSTYVLEELHIYIIYAYRCPLMLLFYHICIKSIEKVKWTGEIYTKGHKRNKKSFWQTKDEEETFIQFNCSNMYWLLRIIYKVSSCYATTSSSFFIALKKWSHDKFYYAKNSNQNPKCVKSNPIFQPKGTNLMVKLIKRETRTTITYQCRLNFYSR